MQFITNGPDVPNELLRAHEDGRVVFFCGAGISYPAGLPGFSGLVDTIYERIGEDPDLIEKDALSRGQYDTVLGLLEQRLAAGRETVRDEVAKILTPKVNLPPEGTATHSALLKLARSPRGGHRLVTTNFDNLFQNVIAQKN